MHDTTERLNHIKTAFQLSEFQLGHLFGIDRSALRHWRKSGIPKTRLPQLEALENLARTLAPATARTIMHWPHPKLERKSPLLAVRIFGVITLCELLTE